MEAAEQDDGGARVDTVLGPGTRTTSSASAKSSKLSAGVTNASTTSQWSSLISAKLMGLDRPGFPFHLWSTKDVHLFTCLLPCRRFLARSGWPARHLLRPNLLPEVFDLLEFLLSPADSYSPRNRSLGVIRRSEVHKREDAFTLLCSQLNRVNWFALPLYSRQKFLPNLTKRPAAARSFLPAIFHCDRSRRRSFDDRSRSIMIAQPCLWQWCINFIIINLSLT